MKVLVDANIFIDYFARRHPFDADAELFILGGAIGDYEMWMSSSQVTDLFFLLTHGDTRFTRESAKETLRQLRKHVRIARVDEGTVDGALDSAWSNFEDACVYYSACGIGANRIITRNKADFACSSVPVMDCAEFLEEMRKEHGIEYALMGAK